jgi:membrane fusion protein, multidrug efflux system
MKRVINVILIILILTALVVVKMIFFPSQSSGGNQKQGDAAKKPEASVVSAYVVKPEKLNNRIFISGSLIANQEVMLTAERAGKIVSIFFKEGQKVTKGQLLIKMNDAVLQAQVKKLKVQEQLAQQKEEREKKLLAINGISQQEYDVALTELTSFRADLALLQAQIDETEIRAPFSGTAGLNSLTEGSYITPSSPVVAIQQTELLKLDFYIPEKYAGMIKPNSTIYFTVEGSAEKFTATITAVEPKVDFTTRTLQMRATFDNSKTKLIPGTDVRVELPLTQNDSALMIPTEAVIPVLKGKKVYVSVNGKAEEVMIQTGVRTEDKIQVLSGLKPGDTLIVTGIMQLKKGSSLKIISVK